MVDKAQIFTSSKGDHYRTRMTHTLCVAQIARSIASRLHMNVPLTEAIALGHDLGHTPFGHQGERTLDKMARDCANIGFKHNFQSLNVASVLEEEYIECSGLDLSVQVLEGMWKHTKIRKSPHDALICDLEGFLPYGISEEARNHLHPENSFCSTVEGQIVFIADEIAQRSHDLDDALSARLLTMDNVIEALSLKKLHTLKAQIEELKSSIYSAQKGQRMFVSERELLVSRVASQVINYFIDDVVKCFEDFLVNVFACFSEVVSSLGMSKDNIFNTSVYQHSRSDLACVCTFFFEVHVLCCYSNVCSFASFYNRNDVDSRNTEYYVNFVVLYEWFQSFY